MAQTVAFPCVDAQLSPRPPRDGPTESRTGTDDRALLSTRPNANTRHFLPGPPPMESTPISVCSQAVIHKVGGFTRTEDASGSETRPRVGHQKFQHFSFTFKIGCADGFLLQQWFVLKHLLAPRKQSVNLLKQLVEDGPSSISDCERAKREKSHGEKCASAAATWCVCAKAKTIPVRDDLMVSSGCERLTKGKKKQCASPPPPAPPPAL